MKFLDNDLESVTPVLLFTKTLWLCDAVVWQVEVGVSYMVNTPMG